MILADTNPVLLNACLGDPLPDDTHAVSVSMPKWEYVERYEIGCPKLHAALRSGYPRFVYHTYVKELNQMCWEEYVNDITKLAFVLPCLAATKRCEAFVLQNFKGPFTIHALEVCDAHVLVIPRNAAACFKAYWQHSGEIISSRLAKYILETKKKLIPSGTEQMQGTSAHKLLQERVASLYRQITSRDVFLYPCGMAAIFAAFRVVQMLKGSGRGKTVLVGFPYVDTLKMLRRPEWSNGDVLFYPKATPSGMKTISSWN
jgi:cystathionine gamma-synthase